MDPGPDQSATALLITSLFVELLNSYVPLDDTISGSGRTEWR